MNFELASIICRKYDLPELLVGINAMSIHNLSLRLRELSRTVLDF